MSTTELGVVLLIGALVVLSGTIAVRVSVRLGLPSLLLYLGLGIILGESVIGIQFSDAGLTQTLGMCALAIILAEGGLTTRWDAVRRSLPLGILLSTVGVAVSVAAMGAFMHYVFGLSWQAGLLLGAVVSSTDAAAIFATLRGLGLPRRVSAALELESGFNDAPIIILVTVLSTPDADSVAMLVLLVGYELVAGGIIGYGIGRLGVEMLRRSALPVSGLYPLAAVALTVLSFALASVAHASGFLAVYVTGLVLGNFRLPHRRATLAFAEGLAWLAQIGLFVLLGLLVSPPQLSVMLMPALAVGAFLLLVARPLSVFASAVWLRVPWRQQAFVSWAGLRGAVPIVLATIPVTAGVPEAEELFNLVFILVVAFTLLQGTSLPLVARLLGVRGPVEAQDVEVEVAPLEEMGAQLLQAGVPEGSRLHGVYVRELRLPAQAVVSLIVRDGVGFVPDPTTRIRRYDQLLVVVTSDALAATERRLRALGRAGALARWFGEEGERVE